VCLAFLHALLSLTPRDGAFDPSKITLRVMIAIVESISQKLPTHPSQQNDVREQTTFANKQQRGGGL